MARKTSEEMEIMKKKFKTTRFWSFSRINTYINCSYSYYLKYIKRTKEQSSNIYSVLGGQFHDILEKFYQNEIEYSQMHEEAENAILNASILDMKFDKNNAEKNEGIENKYFECIKHFFKNHIPVKEKVSCEKDIVIKVKNHYFFGYIDAIHKENINGEDFYIITDYKSSTIYSGKKIEQEGRQLMLYALGLHQKGVPIEKIKIRWNFLKYNSLTFKQKNGKMKTMNAERWAWAGKLKSQLRMNLKDLKIYTENEIEYLLSQCMETNSIDTLPKEIQEKYTITDCYVEVPLSQEILDNLVQEFSEIILEIYKKEMEHEREKKDDVWLKKVENEDSFFCSNICGYTFGQCKCYREYIQNLDMFKKNEYKSKIKEEKKEKDDADAWLEELGLI